MKYILALDQGTTSTRAIVFNKAGRIVAQAQQEFRQIYPQPGWVEHSPQDIMASVMSVIAEVLVRADASARDIAALGITNQRETTIVWDKVTGEPVYNAIVWQCRRTADYCDSIPQDTRDLIYSKTGLILDAYFSATKIKWILDNVQGARERAEKGELLFGTVDTYILWQLTKGRSYATDYTNASRTMLYNIHSLQWDEDLLKLFDIPRTMLPAVKPSGSLFGKISGGALAGVPVCSMAGDQQAALFGQLCLDPGDVKNTYGTGCFLLMNTGNKAVKSENGLLTTLGAGLTDHPCYVLEGSVFAGGAAVQWLRDGLKVISHAAESEAIAISVKNNGGVYVVPAFTGLGAPYWDAHARGTITGLTRGSTSGHIVRATLEAIAYQVSDLVRAMERDSGMHLTRLAVDGGASANNFLMQFQSDILNCEAVRPCVFETTALGVAYLAGLYCKYWGGVDELRSNASDCRVYIPSMSDAERESLLAGWRDAVTRARR
ncbi:MAG: glycerol kinase GlpK [Clostridia bacterium]|nr:glycerol kinase GlpK [Clostridia bacterium]